MKKLVTFSLIFSILLCFPIYVNAKSLDESTKSSIYYDLKNSFLAKEKNVNLGYYALPADDKQVQKELVQIFRQVLCDNPMIFYVRENTIRLTVVQFLGQKYIGMLKYQIDYDFATIESMTDKLNKEIINAKNYVKSQNAISDYDTIVALHDYIALNVKYDENLSNINNNNAYGALVDKKAVCYGFAKAYILLLKTYGFGADIVYSEKMQHAWNVVKFRNVWYHTDLTWDSQYTEKDKICYDYFLKSDSEFKQLNHNSWFSNVVCSESFTMPESYEVIEKTDLSPGDFIIIKSEQNYQTIYRILYKLKTRYKIEQN